MKKDKSFASVIALLVVAVLVVSSLTYFISKKNPNIAMIPKSQLAGQVVSACLPTSSASITIISPNGGETYIAGQQTTVKWTSCNIPNTDNVAIDINYPNSTGGSIGLHLMQATPNTGSAVVTLPDMDTWTRMMSTAAKYGNYYKISLMSDGFLGESNNLFSINAPGTVACGVNSIIGDANGDGKINSVDALLISRISSGTTPKPINTCCVDVNNDKNINSTDAQIVNSYFSGVTSTGFTGQLCSAIPIVTEVCNAKLLYPHPGEQFDLTHNANPSSGFINIDAFLLVHAGSNNGCTWNTYGSLVPTTSPTAGSAGSLNLYKGTIPPSSSSVSSMYILGNLNFSKSQYGDRIYHQSISVVPQSYPNGNYTLDLKDSGSAGSTTHSIQIPISIKY